MSGSHWGKHFNWGVAVWRGLGNDWYVDLVSVILGLAVGVLYHALPLDVIIWREE